MTNDISPEQVISRKQLVNQAPFLLTNAFANARSRKHDAHNPTVSPLPATDSRKHRKRRKPAGNEQDAEIQGSLC